MEERRPRVVRTKSVALASHTYAISERSRRMGEKDPDRVRSRRSSATGRARLSAAIFALSQRQLTAIARRRSRRPRTMRSGDATRARATRRRGTRHSDRKISRQRSGVMTQNDWLPILTKILGPQCIELSHPPTQVVYCMGAFSHNVITEEATIGTAAPFKMLDFFNEVKRRKSNGGGSGLASAKQIITEKMGAELRMLGFTNEELSKLKLEVMQNILASCCADPVPG